MKPEYMLFDRETQATFWGLHAAPIQRMLDYDYIVGRKPSISAIVAPTRSQRFHKCFYGTDEILIPVYRSVEQAAAAHPEADVMVNFASFRTAYGETMAALETETIRTVAVIAYRGPILQSEVVRLRGQRAYSHIRELIERGFVRAEEEGPTQRLSVTKALLSYFGVETEDQLRALLEAERD